MDNLRRFPAPSVMMEEEQCFRVKDANGFAVCSVPHREDLHQRAYQYAQQFLTREEARRIAKAIPAAGAFEEATVRGVLRRTNALSHRVL